MLRCDWLLNQTFIAQSEYRNHLFGSRILIGQCFTRDLNLKAFLNYFKRESSDGN